MSFEGQVRDEKIGWNLLLAQCLASYSGNPGKFFMGFSIVFQASTRKKLRGKKFTEKITGPGKLMLNIPLLTQYQPAVIIERRICQNAADFWVFNKSAGISYAIIP